MTSPFLTLTKTSIKDLFTCPHWEIEDSLDKHDIPSTPRSPTGKGEFAQIEKIDKSLYEPGARMIGFKIKNKERLIFWINTLTYRYHNQMGSLNQFHCG